VIGGLTRLPERLARIVIFDGRAAASLTRSQRIAIGIAQLLLISGALAVAVAIVLRGVGGGVEAPGRSLLVVGGAMILAGGLLLAGVVMSALILATVKAASRRPEE